MAGSLLEDIRFALRAFVRHPGFTLIAVLTLALGIGSAAAIFSVIQNVLIDPAPYADIDRIVSPRIRDMTRDQQGGRTAFQTPEFLEYQRQATVFDEVIAGDFEDVLLSSKEGTEQYSGGIISPNTFQFLGVPALIGRTIVPSDVEPGATPVFVMAYKMWAAHYNMDPAVVGRTFVLNGMSRVCVGVMPRRYTKQNADVWRPIKLDPADPEQKNRYYVFQAKLKKGVTLERASAEMDVIAHRVQPMFPDNYAPKFKADAVSWIDGIVGRFRKTLYTLLAAVGVLLLIACSNVANMLLARAAAREKEMAVRTSIGASRWMLIRQMLVESLALAIAGAIVGCVVAFLGIRGVTGLIPDGLIPHEAVIRVNWPVLGFSLGVAMLTALIFGLMPAIQAARTNMVEPLKDSGRGVIGGFRKGKLRSTLVVLEIALSIVLLTGAGLLMHNLVTLQTIDLGLDPKNVLVARLPFPKGQYQTAAQKQQFFETLLSRLSALHGVTSATPITGLPPYGGVISETDIPGKDHSEKWRTVVQLCSARYFETLHLKLERGRLLSDVDVRMARKVAVVNQTFVKKYLGNDDAIGRQVKLNVFEKLDNGNDVANPVFEIIGVIADARNQGLDDPTIPEAVIPYTITGAFGRGILVRTQGKPEALLESLRREIWAVDRGVALTFAGTLTGFLQQFSYAEPEFSVVLLAIFASVGLLLVAVGVYSVISFTVSRQTREIGIRMALGAERRDVLWMVSAMGLRLIALGVVAGLIASYAAARVLASQLTGVSRQDPVTLVAVIAIITLVGAAACIVPANRAAKVDPNDALRVD